MPHTGAGLVYVDAPVHPDAVDLLSSRHSVVLGYGAEAVTFSDVAAEVEGVLLRTAPFTAGMIAGAPELRVIARHGVGTDLIDVRAAQKRGVHVLITAQANAVSVAEHTIGLLIAASRRYAEADTAVRSDYYSTRDQLVGLELAGKTLAVAGFGRIGARVARVAEAMGMQIRVFDPFLPANFHPPVGELVYDLDTLLAGADALTLHLPLTETSRGMIGAEELAKLAPNALVVNTARGGLINEQALADAVAGGHLGGAGVDVFEMEPPASDNPLLSVPKVQLSPHTGAHTKEGIYKMSVHAAEGISAVMENRELPEYILHAQA